MDNTRAQRSSSTQPQPTNAMLFNGPPPIVYHTNYPPPLCCIIVNPMQSVSQRFFAFFADARIVNQTSKQALTGPPEGSPSSFLEEHEPPLEGQLMACRSGETHSRTSKTLLHQAGGHQGATGAT